ncbi:dTMP kinase [Zhihengliuella flava]|uniref:Thymidylate kinase n=1 Tax=Zhihengliuella flava TaxID=1285193 RepID=A0A931GFW1_9MICC|nr:thymidylate kinase [Zhihengliuella flava]MBG6085112.1 dTMP kinase [Zhihengliuella flava]
MPLTQHTATPHRNASHPHAAAPDRRQSAARPLTVALVGIDGSGKTTAASGLTTHLTVHGPGAQLLSNPSGRSWLGRWSARTGLALPASLAEGVETVLRAANVVRAHAKAASYGAVTVMDRHLVCQEVTRQTRGLDPNGVLARGLRWLRRSLRDPDVTVLLDVSAETALSRVDARGLDSESLSYFEDARNAYLACALTEGWTVIDAEADPERVLSQLDAIIRAALDGGTALAR